jgi:hypothetical protein
MSIRWYSEKDREFLFPNHQLLGTLLTMHPAVLFALLAISASAIFFIPGHLLGLLCLPITAQTKWCSNLACLDAKAPEYVVRNVGILYKLNWSLVYSIAAPLIFSLAALVCRSVRGGLSELVNDGTIRAKDGVTRADPDSFLGQFSASLLKRDRVIFLVSLSICILATIVDQSSNLWNYAHVFAAGKLWQDPRPWNDTDWMHGWTIASYKHFGLERYMVGNFLYYLVAILLQAIAIFAACYFVLLFWVLTQCFASIVISDETDFNFVPFIRDPDASLGLRPIGRMFSTFLVLTLIFQLYAFAHRVQAILETQGMSVYQYFAAATCAFKDAGKVLSDPQANTPTFQLLVCLVGFRDTNPGVEIILVLMLIPLLALAWWPLIRLRRYLYKLRKRKLAEFRASEELARQSENYAHAEYLAKDMEKLGKSSIWPNGFKIGWGFFFLLVALELSTFAPPLIVPLVTGGLGLKVLEKIMSADSDG